MLRFRRALDPRALDPRALATGAAVGLATLATVALLSAQLDTSLDDGDGSSPLVEVLLTFAAVGLAAAGAIAARRCRRGPLLHATGAAVSAVLVAAIAVAVRQLVGDESVRWWAFAAWLLLAVACGLAGGLAALRAPRLRRRADSPT
jgi:MYXO-CTERM domain-containing protein